MTKVPARGSRSRDGVVEVVGPVEDVVARLRQSQALPGLQCVVLHLEPEPSSTADDDLVLAVADSSVPVLVTLRGRRA